MHWRSAKQQTQISPAMIAVIVAVVGQAAILLNDFGPGNHQPANGAVTAAAVRKAGAIELRKDRELASTQKDMRE
jgi:hypothetical protein